MRSGFFYYRRRMDRRTVVRVAVFFFAVLIIALLLTGMARMRPLLESLATTRVSNTVNRIIVEAVNEAILIKFKLIKCLIWVFWIFVVVLFISVISVESKKLIPHLVGQNLSSRYQ